METGMNVANKQIIAASEKFKLSRSRGVVQSRQKVSNFASGYLATV